MQLTETFQSLLQIFRDVFTAPTFATFVTLAAGWCLSPRHRYITEMIQAANAVHRGHHSRYHRFFSNAAWSIDDLSDALALRAVKDFYPEGIIVNGVDDSLCRKRGLTIFGTGMHHDPLISSRKRPWVSWGHDWVILSLIIPNPPWSPTKVWALPVGMRLSRNRQGLTKGKKQEKGQGKGAKRKRPKDPNHRTRPELAVELIERFAKLFPKREIVVSGDSAYGGKSVLQHLPKNVDLISRVAANAALYQPKGGKLDHNFKPKSVSVGYLHRLPGTVDDLHRLPGTAVLSGRSTGSSCSPCAAVASSHACQSWPSCRSAEGNGGSGGTRPGASRSAPAIAAAGIVGRAADWP
jgi:hypothetical protein